MKSLDREPKELLKSVDGSYDKIIFSNEVASYCVGMLDIVGSTRITSRLNNIQISEYYSTFLNFMGALAREYDAVIVKTLGDGILWYFPKSLDCHDEPSLLKTLSCGMAMIDANKKINEIMLEKNLPRVDYRISSDYGRVNIAQSHLSTVGDIFGPTVNMCAKINVAAEPNSMVIGGDLYQVTKSFKNYSFSMKGQFWMGLPVDYPVYLVSKNLPRKSLLTVF